MAGKLSNSGEDDLPAISEINVTPFVDVVLVLLVIFMVTAPMLVREQMNVNLPKAETGEKSASQSLVIVIEKNGDVRIKGEFINLNDLETRVKEMVSRNPSEQAIISADSEAKHGDVVHVIDVVKKAGLTRFAIQIERR